MPPPASPRFPFLAVVGVGHSGSTLLGTLLNGHPSATCVGELARVGEALREGDACSCGTATRECPFWRPLLPLLRGKGDYDWRDLTPEVYEELRRRVGCEVLVDLSKTLAWRMRRPLRSPWRRAPVGYLWVVRDPRGVMASAHREGKPLARGLARHVKWIRRWRRFLETVGERGLTVFYEDLCTDPRRELARVCDWAGMGFDGGMLRPAEHELHMTRANRLRYLGRTNDVRLDERWRRELPAGLLRTIEDAMRRSPFLRERYLRSGGASPPAVGARA